MIKTLGIRHVALKVKHFEECLDFYTHIVGMKIDWQPDNENVYLTNGIDNLALHLDSDIDLSSKDNRLDHFGIMLLKKDDVDNCCLLYTSPSPRDLSTSRMPSSA